MSGDYRVYPMILKSQAPEALVSFIRDVGVPRNLVTDGAREKKHGYWKEIVRNF